jgi:hypothetical protein
LRNLIPVGGKFLVEECPDFLAVSDVVLRPVKLQIDPPEAFDARRGALIFYPCECGLARGGMNPEWNALPIREWQKYTDITSQVPDKNATLAGVVGSTLGFAETYWQCTIK